MVRAVRQCQDALVLVPVEARTARVVPLAERFLDLPAVVEQRLAAVHDARHRVGIDLEGSAILRGEELIQPGASLTDHADVARCPRNRARRADVVVNQLRRTLKHIRLNDRNETLRCRLDVFLRERINRQRQFRRIEAHVHALLRGDRDGLRQFFLVLHVHDTTGTNGVLVGILHPQRRAVLGADAEIRLVVLLVDGGKENALLVGDAENFPRDQISGDNYVRNR